MNIGAFILRRLILQIFVLLGLSIFTFLLMFGLPGDPAAILYSAGGSLGFEEYNHFREKWGLDLPIWKQYTNFITNLMKLEVELFQSHENDRGILLLDKIIRLVKDKDNKVKECYKLKRIDKYEDIQIIKEHMKVIKYIHNNINNSINNNINHME